MCLALDVGRSEASIVDPTKLVIKDIIPYFITSKDLFELKKLIEMYVE